MCVKLGGQRSFLVSANQSVLDGIELDRNVPLGSVLRAPFTLTENAARNQGTLNVPAFDPTVYITPAVGATHFRLIFALGTISDYVYNTTTNKYEPAAPTLNSLSTVIYSPYLPLNAATANQSLIADLPGSPTMTAQVTVVACVGIEFSQLVEVYSTPFLRTMPCRL